MDDVSVPDSEEETDEESNGDRSDREAIAEEVRI